jgi:hypothetical protein
MALVQGEEEVSSFGENGGMAGRSSKSAACVGGELALTEGEMDVGERGGMPLEEFNAEALSRL